jgi:hypothetical protein
VTTIIEYRYLDDDSGPLGTRIVAAAILHHGTVYWADQPARHHHIAHRMFEMGLNDDCETEQGFITDVGRFVRRKPACVIADKAGQLNVHRPKTMPEHTLFSEDLW